MSLPSGKKLLLLGFVVVLLVIIPLTVYLVQQQQKTKSSAQAATVLGFNPAASTINVGDNVNLDLMMNPGINQVSFVKVTITYDPTKLSTVAAGLAGCPENSYSCRITFLKNILIKLVSSSYRQNLRIVLDIYRSTRSRFFSLKSNCRNSCRLLDYVLRAASYR